MPSHQDPGKLAIGSRGQQVAGWVPHLAVFTETRWASLPWTGEGSYTFFMYDERPLFLLWHCTPVCIQVSISGGGRQQAKEDRSILLKGLPPFII